MTIRHTNDYLPGNLDPDEPGDPGLHTGPSPQAQNEAFLLAMNKAIHGGRERARWGVKQAKPEDARTVKPLYAVTHVPTASSSEF